ncbi:glyoxalase-like domain-containing protein [Mrakia frigida]|uniref:VOC family protein n=1 Tax=Mrakia frigida TaxID=29902 RepID=UPI003FCC21FB
MTRRRGKSQPYRAAAGTSLSLSSPSLPFLLSTTTISRAPQQTMSLDHLILLSPPGELSKTVEYLKPWFTIVEGGTHADGLTANSLIPLVSGTYVELIHFVSPPSLDSSHWWGKKAPGHIDWALLGDLTQLQLDSFNKVVSAGGQSEDLAFDEGVKGGRKRPDGADVKWVVTFPGKGQGRGGVPFFCADLTPRELRVPALPSPHPSKTISVSHITLLTTSANYKPLKAYLEALQGSALSSTSTSTTFPLSSPNPLPSGTPQAEIHLRVPQSKDEVAYLSKRGTHALYELGFYTERDGGKEGLEIEGGTGSRFVFRRV